MRSEITARPRPSYEVVSGWEQLPDGWRHLDVADVAVNSGDQIHLLTRYETRVIVLGRDGRFLTSWGEGVLSGRPHGITIGPDDFVYIADEDAHVVRKFTPDGRQVLVIGSAGKPSDSGCDLSLPSFTDRIRSIRQAAGPFNGPTKVALGPTGDIYVSDGYGNARVHRFSPEGELVASWGDPGSGPGQFHLPHGVAVDGRQRVLVADRENDRVQLFSLDGQYLAEWTHLQRPAALFVDRDGLVYVTEMVWRQDHPSFRLGPIPDYGHARVSVLDGEGNVLVRLGGPDPCAAGSFAEPHGVCVDSVGDLYVAEVTWSGSARRGWVPPDCHTFQKLAKRA